MNALKKWKTLASFKLIITDIQEYLILCKTIRANLTHKISIIPTRAYSIDGLRKKNRLVNVKIQYVFLNLIVLLISRHLKRLI